MPRQRSQSNEQNPQAETTTQIVVEKATAPVRHHPIASLGGTGGSIGIFIVYIMAVFGVRVAGVVGATIATACTTCVLVVGRNGLKGIWNFLMNGAGDDDV